jgi:hypothetical protein
MYFSEIKSFREHFEATAYMYIGTNNNGYYCCFLLWSPTAQIFVLIPATL